MSDLQRYVGNYVNIECNSGEKYEKYYVCDFTIWYDNDDREEDSIDLLKNKEDNGGIALYASEIKSIEIVD